jgi:hypothetical protein
LLWLSRKYGDRLKPGDAFLTYLVIYPFGRFWLEFLRLDSSQIAGINANQALSLIVTLAAGFWLFWRHRKSTQLAPEPGSPAEASAELSETGPEPAEANPDLGEADTDLAEANSELPEAGPEPADANSDLAEADTEVK